MKLFAIYITNNVTTYGGERSLCQVVLFVFVPFDKNTLGDIIAIRNISGNIVVTYEYDAWGNCTVMDGYGNVNTSSSFIGNINPIRYRGYYYDTETGFYYLQTRYYDPTICRFINADNYELVAQLSCMLGQLNMYAYCNNNPIMYTDPTGLWIDTVLDVGFLLWGIIDFIRDPSWENLGAIALDVAFMAIPFATGGGQIIKIGNKVDDVLDLSKAINKMDNLYDASRTTMIGRNMNRVQNAGRFAGVSDNLYKAWTGFDSSAKGLKKVGHTLVSMGHNGLWLYSKLRAGYTVIDIGITTAHKGFGLYYGTERFVMSVWQTRNLWKFYIA